jgi:hypothetical protein
LEKKYKNKQENELELSKTVSDNKANFLSSMYMENLNESQTEKVYYNLTPDVSLNDRHDIYKKFLWHCLIDIVPRTSNSTESKGLELVYLNELRLILGLAKADAAKIHNETLKYVFKGQVQNLDFNDFISTQEKKFLKNMQKQFLLEDQTAQDIIKEVQSHKLLQKFQQRMAKCEISLPDLIKMSDHGIKIADCFTDRNKLLVFKENLEISLSQESKTFEKELFLVTYPDVLELHSREIRNSLELVAKKNWLSTFVHVISALKQRLRPELNSSLHELVLNNRAYTCQTALNRMSEIVEIYSFYVNGLTTQVYDTSLRHEIAQTLNITNTEAELLERKKTKK